MEREREHKYREIIERYCSVIGENTAILRTSGEKRVTYECLRRSSCDERLGGCKNEKYGNI